MNRLKLASCLAMLAVVGLTSNNLAAKQHRSHAAKVVFKTEHHCPSTGRAHGACPGYVIDHIKPLACGGADSPANMQWQTVSDAKAKDRWERRGC